jgi:molecular chaperone GrpE
MTRKKDEQKEAAGQKAELPRQDPKDAKIAELTDTLQRLQAEFENYKKRVEKEKEQFAKYCSHRLVSSLLPLLDSFELAIKNGNGLSPGGHEKFRKGVEMIYAQFYSLLEAEGLRPIGALGKKFDPYRHEVLMQQETDESRDGIVLEEFQKGYMLNDMVLRHSKVKIGRHGRHDAKSGEKKQGDEDGQRIRGQE